MTLILVVSVVGIFISWMVLPVAIRCYFDIPTAAEIVACKNDYGHRGIQLLFLGAIAVISAVLMWAYFFIGGKYKQEFLANEGKE
ncbi:MAG: hypothetical protein HKM24_05815 [Gammaproteobacteria bacterium]|nr:hypothetical protein [Gammaproteobacteria bacterium]